MSKVFLLDYTNMPLDPIYPGQARRLLKAGQAAVYRRYPFTLILKEQVKQPSSNPLRLKIDPGSKTTGLALVNDESGEVVWAAELTHRGEAIRHALDTRRSVRRGRRNRTTRYRSPRFSNRGRRAGWLAPSLLSRVENILNWVKRISKLALVTALSQELVRFDLQQMQNSEISGREYQQGELFQYEVREYLLEKFDRTCIYCGAKGVPLEVEHVIARSNGGSNRISNLVLACVPCNQRKGNQDLAMFLKKKPQILKRVQAQLKQPLKDVAAVNTTKWVLLERLQKTGLLVETALGGLTKYNRSMRNLPKTHWVDAACVGASTPEQLVTKHVVPLLITATGRGRRKMCTPNEIGFPVSHRQRRKRYFGYHTGDLVCAVVPKGTRKGTHVGRVAVKANGYFTIGTKGSKVPDVAHRYCQVVHRTDGYSYHVGVNLSPLLINPKGAPNSSPG